MVQREVILNLARRTPNDNDFYNRWSEIGEVLQFNGADSHRVTILVVDQRIDVTNSLISTFPKLKYIVSATTGHTHIKLNPAPIHIKILTLRGEKEFLRSVRSVSEFTLMLMLDLARMSPYPATLNGKTLGVVGRGRIGRQVMELGAAFKMNVISVDVEQNKNALETLCRQSDFVSVHVDENPTTINMINKEVLNWMGRRAYFINTARPSIVDNKALYYLVADGVIRGAACDFQSYFEAQYWYKPIDNFIVTPHIAGTTLEDRVATDKFMIQKVKKELTDLSLRPDSKLLHLPLSPG